MKNEYVMIGLWSATCWIFGFATAWLWLDVKSRKKVLPRIEGQTELESRVRGGRN
jgi:hypothetical protein